ncbi:MAG: type IX secretion system sortase PorU [Bacteroidetes bacterium]|nr:type IX secretion system sortase PorU [Bacteroidota bacterium]
MLLFSSIEFGYGQTDWSIKVNWNAPLLAKKKGVDVVVPNVDFGGFQNNKLMVQFVKDLEGKSRETLSLKSFNSEPASALDLKYLKEENLVVPDKPEFDLSVKNASGKPKAIAVFFPYFKENGQIKRITQLDLELTKSATKSEIYAKSFAANSILQTGKFYRIAVTSDGIYKLDKKFLEDCGFSTSNLNSNSIHVFGNAQGMLSENNFDYRPDDLVNNALFVVDGGDGIFNGNDYVLFYAHGPNRWQANGTSDFSRLTNVYSDESYYYVHISANVAPNRIQDLPVETLTPNKTISTYNSRSHYEVDTKNLVSGGKRWYGDVFDVQLTRSYSFGFPNAPVGAKATLKYGFACTRVSGNRLIIKNGAQEWINTAASTSDDFMRFEGTTNQILNSTSVNLSVTLQRANASVVGYLDYLTLVVEQNLTLVDNSLAFRSLNSVNIGAVSRFNMTSANASTIVWDITDRNNAQRVTTNFSGTEHSFVLKTDTLREFVAFIGSNFPAPVRKGELLNQNLHALPQTDFVILTPPQFIEQASRLANLHRSEGLLVHVVTPQEVYNEFSSGMQDPVAIRQFMRMFYTRGLQNNSRLPKYLLMFGDGIYDPKGRVSAANYLITYQVDNSESYIDALVSDDFFGFLDDNESFSLSDQLDLGIGRLLISNTTIAKQQVDKIEHYMKNGSELYSNPGDCDCPIGSTTNTFGDWRTRYVQIADDQENGYFITQDIEPQVAFAQARQPAMNPDKIILDAYQQISNAGGQRYPDAVDAINDRIRRGALVINYVGHGGEVGVAEERVITVPQILDWKNSNALPLFVTATCEFTKYDDPTRVSAGEWASLNPKGGAIALMTTTRSVYFSVNTETGKSFFKNVFNRDSDSLSPSFGEIIMSTKNGITGSGENKRSFTLIGDPALRIAMPRLNMKMDSVYREGSIGKLDTIRALDKITVVGHIEDVNGNLMSNFQGVASPTVFDKPKTFYTLGQDGDSPVLPFTLQKNALYKGKATVENGYFKMTFIVPKDIDYQFGKGRLSLYGNNSSTDAFGVNTEFIVGGVNPNGIEDKVGPETQLFMNDENFVDGGITDETPLFIAKIKDENGINAVGNGIGHDITLVLDDKTDAPYVLNEYYQAGLDSYQEGRVEFNMPKISPGDHTLTFKIWDVNNNSSQHSIRFTEKEKEKPELAHVLNYPNPFTTKTEFFFEHNQVNSSLETQIQIFTVSGRLVKTINKLVNTSGFRSAGIPWDGKDDFGDQLAKGVYIYRLSIRNMEGETAEQIEKLVILK